ncbi:MAG TPA: hypothetical protein P5076_17615, partial [Myxococcota bacterium]|nr:hypothetical protein [Myxococcota bacterium]
MPRRRELSPRLVLGGFQLELQGEAVHPLPARLRPFQTRGGDPQLTCEGELGPVAAPGSDGDEILADPGGVWVLHRWGGELHLTLRLGGPGGKAYQRLSLGPDLMAARARLDPSLLQDRPPFALREPLLELWLSLLLFSGHGLLLHATGLLTPQGVLACAGPSGAGKSTLAGLFAQAGAGTLLTDDRLILRPEGEDFRAWGSPWHGTAGCASPASGRLAGLYVLEKAGRAERLPLGAAEAAMHLAANCFRGAWPPEGARHVLETCARLAERLPCYRLRFTRQPATLAALTALL